MVIGNSKKRKEETEAIFKGANEIKKIKKLPPFSVRYQTQIWEAQRQPDGHMQKTKQNLYLLCNSRYI